MPDDPFDLARFVSARECCGLLLQMQECSIVEILGHPDDLKFRSCLTLFREAAPAEPVFSQWLARYYSGFPDPRTLSLCAVERR